MDPVFTRSKNFPKFSSQPGQLSKLSKSIPHDLAKNAIPNEHSNFLRVYFNFTYYLLITPFRFRKLDLGQGKYELCQWLPQQILCGVASVLAFITFGTNVRNTLSDAKRNDPVSFFLLFYSVSLLVSIAALVRGFWTKKQTYLRLVNCLQNHHIPPYNPYKMESVSSIRLICIACTVVCLTSFFFQTGFGPDGRWSLDVWVGLQIEQARYIFLLENDSPVSWMNGYLTVVSGLSYVYFNLFSWFGELLLVAHVWSLWAPTSGFASWLQQDVDVDVNVGKNGEGEDETEVEATLEIFEALKHLSFLIERTVGDVLIFYIGQTSFYYAVLFERLILPETEAERVDLIMSYAFYLSILILSAEIVKKMRWFKAWLQEQSQLDHNRVAVFMDELEDQKVGISAAGVFTFNYSFVGTVMSTLITYFTIRLQSGSVTKV